MKVISPIEFATGQLISSNAIEIYPAYSNPLNYGKGDRVDYGTFIYESLINSNMGNQPDISPTAWVVVGPDNTHAMFDTQVSTQTTSSSPLVVTVKPGVIVNSCAFLELEGSELLVEVRDGLGGTLVYSNTVLLDDTVILDWSAYFFEEYRQKKEVVLTDIPSYLNAYITITLSGPTDVKIGIFSYGTIYDIGDTQYGATVGIRDFSIKETDDFGNVTFIKRAFSKRMQANVMLPNSNLTFNSNLLSKLRATPCVWIGSESETFKPLVVFGFYRDFNIDVSYPSHSLCNIEIEGMI